jgi:CBS domain-containing protein
MRVKEMMATEPVYGAPETPLGTIAAMMVEHHCGAIPILDNGKIAGIVTDRDITCRTLPREVNPLTSSAKDVMTRRVITIGEDDRAETAARMMEHAHIRRLPVIDAESRLVGMISATDLAMKAEELAAGSMFPKVAHHVPRKTSARFVDWM